jgi:hypothetical protein
MKAPKLFSNLWRRTMRAELSSVGLSQNIWTPTVDLSDVVQLAQPAADLADKAVTVSGLTAPATLDVMVAGVPTATTIDNGMVVIFNIEGVAVGVLG